MVGWFVSVIEKWVLIPVMVIVFEGGAPESSAQTELMVIGAFGVSRLNSAHRSGRPPSNTCALPPGWERYCAQACCRSPRCSRP